MQPLRRGDTGPAVAEVRAMLHGLGLLPEAEGEAYDAATERAVRAFQQSRGLAADGVVGVETYRALGEARWLLDRGFDVGRCDGIFGARTEAALTEFQRNAGVKADGIFGPATQRAIANLRRAIRGGRADHL